MITIIASLASLAIIVLAIIALIYAIKLMRRKLYLIDIEIENQKIANEVTEIEKELAQRKES